MHYLRRLFRHLLYRITLACRHVVRLLDIIHFFDVRRFDVVQALLSPPRALKGVGMTIVLICVVIRADMFSHRSKFFDQG